MPDIRFRCPHCTGEAVLPDWMAGQEILCRYCARKLLVPVKSLPDRRAARDDEVYEVDEAPRDARESAQKYNTPEYRCEICGTCIPVLPTEIGVRKFCPDCGTPFSVTAEWFEADRRRRREERKRSWTDPAIRLHPERYAEPSPPAEVYGVAPQAAKKASELIRWPEPKQTVVTAVCKTCASVIYIEKSQIGTQVRCPNCAAPFSVTQGWFDAERKRRRKRLEKREKARSESEPAPARPSAPAAPPSRTELVPFNCAHCGALFYARKAHIGKKMRCPDCGTPFHVTQERYDRAKRRGEKRQARLSYGGAPAFSAPSPLPAGAAPSSPEPEKKVPPEKRLIPVLCGLCGTLLYAERSQVGQQIRCPDCETFTTVTLPLNESETAEPPETGGYSLAPDPPA